MKTAMSPPVRVGQAAEMLGVGVETLRRWESEGRLTVIRSPGGQRLVPLTEVTRILDWLSVIREVQPDVVFTTDPWLPYEAHRDHRETFLVTAEAGILAGPSRLPGSRPEIDAAWLLSDRREITAVAFYHSATPNVAVDIDAGWQRKVAALSEYRAQFEADEIPVLVAAIDARARLVATSLGERPARPVRAEGLNLLHPRALHGAA